jgi:hypothetical protein
LGESWWGKAQKGGQGPGGTKLLVESLTDKAAKGEKAWGGRSMLGQILGWVPQ